MRKSLIFVALLTLSLTGSVFAQAQQAQRLELEATTEAYDGVAEPITKSVTRNVAVSTAKRKTKPNPNVRYVQRSETVTTGYRFSVPGQTVKVNAEQVQTMMAPFQDNLNSLRVQVEANTDQIQVNTADIAGLKQVDAKTLTVLTDLTNRTMRHDQEMLAMKRDIQVINQNANQANATAEEALRIAKKKPGRIETIATSAGISVLTNVLFRVFDKDKTVVNNNGGGNGGSNCWKNGRYVCGVYNPPVGGNCKDRGNCNVNNGGNGGPRSVANGSGSSNGNFPFGPLYSSGSSGTSSSGNNSNNGGQVYNTPVNNNSNSNVNPWVRRVN